MNYFLPFMIICFLYFLNSMPMWQALLCMFVAPMVIGMACVLFWLFFYVLYDYLRDFVGR
jgi:ABC-type proline/glycine betaine transport system permease subunit